MRVASWNINGIKARATRVDAWLKLRDPDIVAIQEVKTSSTLTASRVFGDNGYEVTQTEHVAIASKRSLGPVEDLLGDGRLLAINSEAGRFICAYVPNGQKAGTSRHDAKLDWLATFVSVLEAQLTQFDDVIIAADLNIARSDLDVWAPDRYRKRNLFTSAERSIMADIIGVGLVDVFRQHHGDVEGLYSWWNYAHDSFNRNRGWRLDYILATAAIADRTEHAIVDVVERSGESTSDHAPLWIDF